MPRNFELLLMLLLLGQAMAATSDEQGGLCIANALGRGSGPMVVTIDGRVWNCSADHAGQVSPTLYLACGSHRLHLAREGLAGLDVRLRIDKAVILHLVAHVDWHEASQRWRIGVRRLEEFRSGEQRQLQLLSLSQQQCLDISLADSSGRWCRIALERFQPQRLPLTQERGYMPLRAGRKMLPAMPVVPGASHDLLFYDDENGGLHCLWLRHRTWVLSP